MSNNRYEIGESIGAGGLGAVYKALDTQLQREVAIKRILSTKNASEEEVKIAGQKLLEEAQTLSLLNHPNIVTVFDVGQDEEGGFVVMELLNGETLDDTIARGVLTQEDFTEVVIQTMEALIAAQALNVLHRDLKPPNIMVIWQPSGKFQTKILDFGLAKFSKAPSVQTMDQDDAVMGSIFFMSPEQFERAELDYCSDMYQIGCVYYHSLTGQYPFRGETAPQVMNAHLQHRVTPLEKLRPDLAPSICQWVMWLINRDMANRPVDARQALDFYPKNPEAAPAIPVEVEPTQATGTSTVKIVSAPTHDATPPSRAILTKATGSAPVLKVATGNTGPLSRTGPLSQTGPLMKNVTGSAPIAQPSTTGHTGIPVQAPKSRKTLWTVLAISVVTILSAIGFVVVSKNKEAADEARFLELSKMEEVVGTEKDVDLVLKVLIDPKSFPAEKTDARKILIGFKGAVADTKVLELLKTTEDASQFVPLTYILSEREYTPAVPTMLASFRRIPDGKSAKSRRVALLKYIRQVATKETVPEMLKSLASEHESDVRRMIEDIILAVLRKQGNGNAVTEPLLSQASRTTNDKERQSLFRILGLLGGEATRTRLNAVFKGKSQEIDYKRNAMVALMNWQNREVLPLIEELAGTSKDEALRLVSIRAHLRVASLPAPLTNDERVQTWQKSLDLSKKDSRRLGGDIRYLITVMMDYPDAATEAKLNQIAGDPVLGGMAKSALTSIQKTKKALIEVGKVGEFPATQVGVRGDRKASLDRFNGALAGWNSPETWFAWYFKVKEAGTYQVDVLQSNPLEGTSEFQIIVGDQLLAGESKKTEAFMDYKPVTLGDDLKLEPGKNYTLFLKAGSKVQPRMMNVKMVQLIKK